MFGLEHTRGPLLVTAAACTFAGANAAATAIYRRGGTVVGTFLLRCVVVYIVNGAIVARNSGRAAAINTVLLRTGRRRSSHLAAARAFVGAVMGVLLNVSFVLLTFADAFTIFKGIDTLSTIALSRALLGSEERLSLREAGCGALTMLGIVLIAQPPFLFGADAAAHVTAGGLLVATMAGMGSGGFNFFTRLLSMKGGEHQEHLPPAMLLSFFMVVVFSYVALIGAIAHVSGLSSVAGWEWTRFALPAHAADWSLLGVYCCGILVGQLMMAAGAATTRASIAAFLALTELAFSYVLGATALGEPTSLLAGFGTGTVFGAVVLLALKPARRRAAEGLARADSQTEMEQEQDVHEDGDDRRVPPGGR